jgi:hypothetical protein
MQGSHSICIGSHSICKGRIPWKRHEHGEALRRRVVFHCGGVLTNPVRTSIAAWLAADGIGGGRPACVAETVSVLVL